MPRRIYAWSVVGWGQGVVEKQADVAGRPLSLVVALGHSVDWQISQVERIASRRTLLRSYNVEGIQVLLYSPAEESDRP